MFGLSSKNKHHIKTLSMLALIMFFVGAGLMIVFFATIKLPDLNTFEARQVAQSTKIYDRTGDVVLYDVHGTIKRSVVPYDQISEYVKQATVAVEDDNFYNHNGIEPSAILRAILINLKNGNLLGGQGGSTITQQVLKNALLTTDKKVSRKIKEWVLAPRLEKILTKDEILNIYLNEVPYGGTVYGVQEASQRFFAKDASEMTLAESAYVAALPQAPTYFSPYGNNRDALEERKNFVLEKMFKGGMITEQEKNAAQNEVVEFERQEEFGIKAPHFVMYIREQLELKYGKEAVEEGGLQVITTIDWDLQKEAEEIVKKHALANKEKYDAENGAIVAIDPKTGQILSMVGSRNYFDEEIDGNFNIATAERQPGSAFKPIVYAEAFNRGYRPETVVFDVSTEFSTTCSSGGNCYRPVNYDGKYNGPMSLRNALAQSVNVPAVKVLYLVGIQNALSLAKDLGIETLTNVKQYGLTLVLGGGEVRPLDMASVYGVFATGGERHEIAGILKVENQDGKILEEFEDKSTRVLPKQTALMISDVLSDNVARTPAFGANSYLNFPGIDVAVKTGTTNDYRDAWIVGYTPAISIAAWAGNNDNRSMDKKVAGFIVAPMWNEVMNVALQNYSGGSFENPAPLSSNVKPIIAGFWKGEQTKVIDRETGEEANSFTPFENRQTIVTGGGSGVHSILHYINRADPLGPNPSNPFADGQYAMWEAGVQSWLGGNVINTDVTEYNPENSEPKLSITSPSNGETYLGSLEVYVTIRLTGTNKIRSGTVYINGSQAGEINTENGSFSFIPNDIPSIKPENNLTVEVIDELGNKVEESIVFGVR